jgi:SAM-dependent methyltransferase
MDLREVPSAPFRRHPWELARMRFFRALIAEAQPSPRSVLDAGAGDGFFAQHVVDLVAAGARVVCWDANYDADEREDGGVIYTRARPAGRFELVLLMDVLEHIDDDAGFLSDVVRQHLTPGGLVVISVPAWSFLYGNHDVALGHVRRYAPVQLAALIEGCGLRLERQGSLFHTLVLARVAQNVRDRVTRAAPATPDVTWRHGEASGRLVEAALRAENALSGWLARAGVALPGLTSWALCRPR